MGIEILALRRLAGCRPAGARRSYNAGSGTFWDELNPIDSCWAETVPGLHLSEAPQS
jgi:hypothetical protein